MEEKFAQLKTIVAILETDMEKFVHKGNKSAGIRLRKNLQEMRELAADLRKEILATRNNTKMKVKV
ncbi:MAG: histone H1 [Bacteroidetes bacterium]|nr:histone H1 [Bacteroidota bacterium]